MRVEKKEVIAQFLQDKVKMLVAIFNEKEGIDNVTE